MHGIEIGHAWNGTGPCKKNPLFLLTIWNEDGDSESESDNGGSDGYKSLPGDGFLHVKLHGLAGKEEGVDAHSAGKDHQGKTNHHRQGEACMITWWSCDSHVTPNPKHMPHYSTYRI